MKNVLLATTALVFTAGFAAAEIEMGATAKLGYGNYGTGTAAGGARGYIAETDVTFTLSGEASGIAYSASAGIDEDGETSVGVISMSAAGFTVAYGVDEFGGLVKEGDDGEDDDKGDIKVSYANGGITGSYEATTDNDDYDINLGFTTGGLTLGVQSEENNNVDGGDATNTVSIGYTMDNIAIAVSADDADDWDASLAYTMGETTVTVGTDEIESHYLKIATNLNGLSLTARYEVDGNTAADTAEQEVAVGYTMGDMSVAVAYDSGQQGKYGDEAETTLVVGYDLGGVALEFKANGQEEMEATAAFTF